VYGLGCDPDNPVAVAHLLHLKKRSVSKGLILVAAELEQLEPYLQQLDADMKRRLMDSWPGPVTWLVPAAKNVPEWLRGQHDTLAVRVSDHPVVEDLCRIFGGALVSTSANISNHPALCSPLAIQRVFGGSVDYILHGPLGGLSRPTEIRDAVSGKVIRSA
jgi:L-threonylcarbamoyladenylate synthase